MAQSKEKKTTTINIDKINGIENENEIDGFVITDEVKERFSSGISETIKKLKSIGIDIQTAIPPIKGLIEGLGNYLTPERIRELDKQWTIFKQKSDLSKKSYESECEHFQKATGLYFDFKHFFIWLRKDYERDFYIFSEKEFRDKVLEFYCIEELSRKEKRENFINNYKNLLPSPAPKAVGKEIKDILKANEKHRHIINVYDELFAIHKDHGIVLAMMGRRTDLNVGTETSIDKDRTDIVRRMLKEYGRVK